MSTDLSKAPGEARFVKIMSHTRDDRGFTLIPHASRCIRATELHEIVLTDSAPIGGFEGGRIDRVGFLGFAEFVTPAIIERGDIAYTGERVLGEVIGFDECHFPNHYNIIIRGDVLLTGASAGLKVGETLSFKEHL
jgi:L-arabinose 1-dehydrogenase